MANKKRSASSGRWLQEHFSDKYVQMAQKKGLRSRAWFKLEEIQQGDNIFRPGMTIVDLGAAPGGWSQYAVNHIGQSGRVIACDLLPMDPIVGVDFLQGDFRDENVLKALLGRVGDKKVQVVMSDMAPNMSGTPICAVLFWHRGAVLLLKSFREMALTSTSGRFAPCSRK